MSRTIYGTANNGGRVDVAFPFFTGTAGARIDGGHGEIAFPGTSAYLAKPVKGRVNGAAAEVTSLRKSAVSDGLLVAQFRFIPEGM